MLNMLLIPANISWWWDDCQKIRHNFPNFPVVLTTQLWSLLLHFLFIRRINSGDQKGAIFWQILNHYLCIPLFWSSVCLLSCLQLMLSLCEWFVLFLCHFWRCVFLALCPDVARLPEFQEMHGSGTDPPLCLMIGYTDGMQIWSISVSTF